MIVDSDGACRVQSAVNCPDRVALPPAAVGSEPDSAFRDSIRVGGGSSSDTKTFSVEVMFTNVSHTTVKRLAMGIRMGRQEDALHAHMENKSFVVLFAAGGIELGISIGFTAWLGSSMCAKRRKFPLQRRRTCCRRSWEVYLGRGRQQALVSRPRS